MSARPLSPEERARLREWVRGALAADDPQALAGDTVIALLDMIEEAREVLLRCAEATCRRDPSGRDGFNPACAGCHSSALLLRWGELPPEEGE